MCTGSLPKCCASSASVILPHFVKICQWLFEKCPTTPYSATVKKWKVIRNPHVHPDHQQKLVSPLAHAYHDWLTSVSTFVSYHTQNDRQTDRQNERSHHSASILAVDDRINYDVPTNLMCMSRPFVTFDRIRQTNSDCVLLTVFCCQLRLSCIIQCQTA